MRGIEEDILICLLKKGLVHKMFYKIDDEFKAYFKNLKQVFMYVINECNLNCPQCIYKPNNYFNIGNKEILFEDAVRLISDFYDLGARKLSLLGGEPTLYGKYQKSKSLLPKLIRKAKDIGYEYVRMDTNGTFLVELLDDKDFKNIDEISFSMDGYDLVSCNKIRGEGVYELATHNIKESVKRGYNIDITCCVYQEMLEKDSKGNYLIENLIFLADKLGVKRVNFHALIKDGTPIDLWSSNLQVEPSKWVEVYNAIQDNIKRYKYPISVRLPKLFVTKEEFLKNKNYYGYCPAKLGERILVHPDGILRICSSLLGTAYGVADYYEDKIEWNRRKTNELISHNLNLCTKCTNRGKKDYGEFIPLCFSLKPKQDEFVFQKLLNWEQKKID